MSHTVTIQTQVRDAEAVRKACTRLALPVPVNGVHTLFDGQKCSGYAVQLPDWIYPVVCDTTTGSVRHDNFGGRWGKQEHLDSFMQAYAAEKAKIEARKKGYRVSETKQADGSIRMTLHAGS